VELAERLGGEIVNADSMQVYRHLDIGTAKPTPEQRARVPHHLFDVVDPDASYHAARYATEARAAVRRIQERGRVPLLVGGTGLYLRAFLEGLIDAGGADPELRRRLEREHAQAVEQGDPTRLHRRLAELDPAAARRIHAHDVRRTIRAFEVIEHTGRLASQVHAEHGRRRQHCGAVLTLVVDPGREALRGRIDARCHAMIERGLLQEVRGLYALGYGPELRPLQAIGYRHMHPVAEGRDTLVNAAAAMRRDTHQFARRQRTWLRSVAEAIWIDPAEQRAIVARAERFLAEEAERARGG
jgi:tRNA dimethylallyltransferase